METKIYVWSLDGTVDGDFNFEGFISQATFYFNRYGHLPKKGDTIAQDENSKNTSEVVYVDMLEYSGIRDGSYSIGIGLTTMG